MLSPLSLLHRLQNYSDIYPYPLQDIFNKSIVPENMAYRFFR
ncbi:hypothetical protein ES319_D03G067400v1 [Gossypium barbadense]|uniref:Uncharacterized protein n=2 Tax=Gossypium TaxID=3633 RepID=A0A5J5S1K9_GOSBA|nr:hypothetical protein ES319_D03G067400v1 [Gossypium barbadense]TYG75946.1 hypothetical protein ES288_D03G073900v1 [Gossypium darwinii]